MAGLPDRENHMNALSGDLRALLAVAREQADGAASSGDPPSALKALLHLDTRVLDGVLARLTASADPGDRLLAVRLLAARAGSGDLDRVLAIAEEEQEAAVRAVIAEELRQAKAEASSEQLRELARHPDDLLRRAVAARLYGERDELALELLVELARDPDPETRNWAAWALADGFPQGERRDSALERWLRLSPGDSQLVDQVMLALQGAETGGGTKARTKADRSRSKSPERLVVLVASANPIDTGQLALDEEVRAITSSLRATPLRDVVELRSAWAARPLDLLSELNEHRPAVLHFSGHGTADGRLVFQDDRGEPRPVEGEAVAASIETAGESVQVVVLNACFSADLARALTRFVDVAVGMDRPVGDDAARIFAAKFYSALGYGRSVGGAFEQARAALAMEGMDDRHAPQLSAKAGVDPHELVLVDAGATRRYQPQEDREVLIERSCTHLAHMARHTSLPLRQGVHLDRELTGPLLERAHEGSLLLVGEPGSGKTGALHSLAGALTREGRDVVVLAADLVGAAGQRGLAEELGLQRGVFEALAAWPGPEPGFLLIDALDAARGREAASALTSLVAQVAEGSRRWRVIASIRSFDLRHSPELRDAFAVTVPDDGGFLDAEFMSTRHFAVGRLTEGELQTAGARDPALGAFLAQAPSPVRDLARVPFNLRLLCSLLGVGNQEVNRLRALRTQLELLDVYWERRVLQPLPGRDGRVSAAERFCEHAVELLRLRVPRRQLLASGGDGASVDELLSAGVLVEDPGLPGARREQVAFSHHLLFDYALQRLLLAGGEEQVAERLESSQDFVLLARPSIVLRLVSAMHADGSWQEFWALALRLAAEPMPVLARLIAPAVAVEQISEAAQLQPLLEAVRQDEPTAVFLLRHLVSALTAFGSPGRPLPGAELDPWSELADCLAHEVTTGTVYPLRLLVWGMTMELEELTEAQLGRLGSAARALLAWGWSQQPPPWVDIQTGLEAVARSCATDPDASREVLATALSSERVAEHGHRELRELAEEVPHLLHCLPGLVQELYETVFGREESSVERTSLGMGQILGLTSTRRQDWEMIRYALAEQYPTVIAAAPSVAVRVAGAACLHEASRYGRHRRPEVHAFSFRGHTTGLLDDLSGAWDSFGSGYRDSVRLLDALQQALAQAAETGQREHLETLLEAIAEQSAVPAGVLRRVLRAGAQAPAELSGPLLELVLAPEILIDQNTREPAGTFIARAYEHWDAAARKQVEQAIYAVAEVLPQEQRERGHQVRDHLIGFLPAELIVTTQARRLHSELEPSTGPAESQEVMSITSEWTPLDEQRELRARGIDTELPDNQALLAQLDPVRQFIEAHRNDPPSDTETHAALAAITQLRASLDERGSSAIPQLADELRAWLSDAASVLASQKPVQADGEPAQIALELALEGVDGRLPEPDANYLQQFEEGPYWGVPAGRIEAARALLLLTRSPELVSAQTQQAITRLASDPVPAVRWAVAHLLNVGSGGQGDRAQALLTRLASEESSAPVLAALLHSIACLAREEPQQAFTIAEDIYERELHGGRRTAVLSDYAGFLLEGWIVDGHPAGRRAVDGWLIDIAAAAPIAQSVFYQLRGVVTAGDDTPGQIARRERAILVWADLTTAAWRIVETAARQQRDQEQSEADADAVRALAKLVDTSARELYFASGTYGEQQPARGERMAPRVRRRFYREADPVIETLCAAGIPSIAHHVLQTLASFVSEDPRGVLLRVGRVLDAGRPWGYQLESLAESEFVKLVERYLAAHRDLFLRDRECREVLVRASEGFLEAGWPSARRLIYGLDDMFR